MNGGLAAFKSKWRHFHANGTTAAYHQLGLRARLITRVKEDLRMALASEPTRRYREIPQLRSVRDDVREPWERIENPFLYETRTKRCLAFIETFRSPTPPAAA